MNYRPLRNKLIVKIVTKKNVTFGTTELTIARGKNHKEWSEECLWAKVLKTGPDVLDIQEGQIIVMGGAAGKWIDKELTASTDTHRIIDEDEVLAIDEEMTAELARGVEPTKEEVHAN